MCERNSRPSRSGSLLSGKPVNDGDIKADTCLQCVFQHLKLCKSHCLTQGGRQNTAFQAIRIRRKLDRAPVSDGIAKDEDGGAMEKLAVVPLGEDESLTPNRK